ncbi:MAG TPA: hypothetical protein VFE62_27065 [Gemmataceae bacterium]|nr:hypothetical protein [Gemmataceae bacterium]
MMRAMWIVPLAGLIFVNVGCRNTCNQPCYGPGKVYVPPGGAPAVVPGVPTVTPGTPTVVPNLPPPPSAGFGQPGAFPTAPQPGAKFLPPNAQPPSISPMPPAGADASKRVDPEIQRTESPEPPRNKPNIQLYAPETIDKEQPSPDKKPAVQGGFPAIPGFAVAKDNIYAGFRPPLDGLNWLAQNGVQTVVHVRLGTTDDAADKMQVEARKMQYVSFVVTPQTLTKEKAAEFTKLIRDAGKNGIFVYDEDGALASALWYLHFRWGEFLDDDASQLRAAQLGLRPNAPGLHRDMWLAVQKLLSENN